MERQNVLLSAAVAGLILGTSACSSSPSTPSQPSTPSTDERGGSSRGNNTMMEGKCYGVNACKGQSACGGKGHSCAGKNSCEGMGWEKMDRDQCEEEGGNFDS